MKNITKISIIAISIVLVSAVLLVGVLAATYQQFNLSGNVSFSSTNIAYSLKCGILKENDNQTEEDFTDDYFESLNEGEKDNFFNVTASSYQSNWDIGNLDFDESGIIPIYIRLEFRVAEHSNNIEIEFFNFPGADNDIFENQQLNVSFCEIYSAYDTNANAESWTVELTPGSLEFAELTSVNDILGLKKENEIYKFLSNNADESNFGVYNIIFKLLPKSAFTDFEASPIGFKIELKNANM